MPAWRRVVCPLSPSIGLYGPRIFPDVPAELLGEPIFNGRDIFAIDYTLTTSQVRRSTEPNPALFGNAIRGYSPQCWPSTCPGVYSVSSDQAPSSFFDPRPPCQPSRDRSPARTLNLDPAKRTTREEASNYPYLQVWHDPRTNQFVRPSSTSALKAGTRSEEGGS